MNTIILIFLVLMWLGIFLLWLFRKSNSGLKICDLKIPKKKFVQQAIQWCSSNLGTIKYNHQIKIYYYRNNKYSDRSLFNGKQIVIYLSTIYSKHLMCLIATSEFIDKITLWFFPPTSWKTIFSIAAFFNFSISGCVRE